MEKLLVLKRYDELLDLYTYEIKYSKIYRLPKELVDENMETFVKNKLVDLAILDFSSLEECDIDIIDFTR